MTAKRLRKRLIIVGCGLTALLIAAIVFRVAGEDEAYGVVTDLSPLLIAIVAAYLASRFQERASFLTLLRTQWSGMVDAKNALIAHTHERDPTPESFAAALRQLSKAIDEMRGVYRNVGETDEYRGWYPYQPLHDMREAFEEFGERQITAEKARTYILESWDALRPHYLVEFDTPEPESPIWWQDERDRRKDDVAPERAKALMEEEQKRRAPRFR